MNRKAKKIFKAKSRTRMKGVLAGVLAFNSVGMVVAGSLNPGEIHKINAEAITNSSGKKTVNIDGVSIALDQELNDNGDGTYSLTLKSSSNLKYEDLSLKMTKVRNGYYKAEQTGRYMIEIYGGKGGNGQDTIYSKGGKGGSPGHLYAVADLKAGDIIYYTIGGNGTATIQNDSGGGANGDGGDHGDTGSYYVGGGGGYTALYKFGVDDTDGKDADHFINTYLNADGTLNNTSFLNSDRTTKYIMIAGGGGGGGAGNAFSLVDKAVRAPDGGNAGNFGVGKATLDDGFAVSGTLYAGQDGFSSGKNQSYIGKGGTEKPGEVNSTFISWFQGKEPNDWAGTQNSKYPGGSGGAGNLRGGAGGAGFAGGSGGVMTGLLVGTNVGGGGGGSSFIASSLSDPLEEDKAYLVNHNESTTGGAVYISYMPTEEDFNYLKKLGLSGDISKYFDVVDYSASNSDGSLANINITDGHITSSNLKATPSTEAEMGVYSTINIKLKPKSGFMGGNDVPIYASDNLTFNYTKSSVSKTADIALVEKCAYVNVPYAFDLKTFSYTKNGSPEEPNKELHVYDLFEDKGYVAAKQSSTFEYDFIDAVTEYQITSEDGSYSKNELLTLTESKSFDISFKVTPKDGSKAIVGEKLSTKTYTKKAKVTLVAASKNSLNGVEIQYQKTLNYDPSTGYYTLALNAKANIPSITPPATITTNKYTYDTSKTGSFVAPETGYYFVQLWGGKGGNGGNAAGEANKGGKGGEPGYVGELIRFNKDDVIEYSIGQNGADGSKGNFVSRGDGGDPGYGTYIKVNSEGVLAAAGSGGGGGALWTAGGSGGDATDVSSTYFTGNFNSANINGGQPPSGIVNTNPGTSGTNYKSAAYYSANPLEGAIDQSSYKKADYTNNNGGAFYITYVGDKTSFNYLSDYSIEGDFTDDFELVASSLGNASGNTGTNYITEINPNITNTGTNLSFDFTASFILKPADTCLGGVDVKLLDNLYIRQADVDGIVTNDEIECDPQDPTDYANVRILPSLLDQFSLTTVDVSYIAGDEPIDSATLYGAVTSFAPTGTLGIKEASEGLPATVSPDQTTDYSVSYGIKSTKEAEKAVVGPNIDPVLIQLNSRVTVHNVVTYNLTNMSVEAPMTNIDGIDHYTFVPGEDYEATFTAGIGMELPEDITVLVNGTPFTKYTYATKSTDEKSLVIKGEDLVNAETIVITAAAKERTFKLHYLVSLDASGVVTQDYVVDLKAGLNGQEFQDALDALLANHPVETAESFEGYTYTIEYPDGTPLTEMPAYDVWINGCYHPNPRNLTIHYVNESYEDIGIENYVDTDVTCYYRKDIDVISPEKSGYAPVSVMKAKSGGGYEATTYNPARLQFVMPDADLDLYVLYKDISSSVVINFECKDPEVKLPEKIIQSGIVGNPYEFDIPSVDGYEPSVSSISGTYSEQGDSYVVTYSPKTYTISFDSNFEGAEAIPDRTVFYNHEIGYTGDTYEEAEFNPLPTPIRVGYNFKGWFLNGFVVTGLDVYTLENNGTLVAMWEQTVTNVTEDNCIVNFNPEQLEYNGLEQHPTITVSVNGATLTEGTDFDVTWPLESTVVGSKDVIIRFKGIYKGEIEASYSIVGKNIPTENLEVEDISGEYIFTGEEIKPTPYVKDNGVELTYGQDYYYEYKNNIDKTDPAKPTQVIVHFMGNYANTPDYAQNFTIVAKNATEGSGYITVEGITDPVTYSGEAFKPSPLVVKLCDGLGGETLLVEGKDFIVDYDTNTDAGTGTVTIKFINNYANTPDEVKTFTIKPITTDLDLVSWTDLETSYLYDGSEQKPTPTIFYGEGTDKVELVEGVDYILTYDDNTDVNSEDNKPTIHVNFIGNYDGVKDIEFVINPRVLKDLGEEFELTPTSDSSNPIPVLDTDPEQKIPLEIYDDEGNLLEEGKDFDIVDGDEPGEKEIVFKGDYEGNDPISIYVEKTEPTIEEVLEEYNYTGDEIKPKPEIKFGDDVLEEGVDYILEYLDNKEPGEGKIIITYISDPYKDLKENPETITFDIVATQIVPALLDIDEVDPVTYDGTAHYPTPAVYYNGVLLTPEVDYTYTYGENIHAGEGAGRVTINFIGGFSGKNINVYFDILPKEVTNPSDPSTGLTITPTSDPENKTPRINNGEEQTFEDLVIKDNETGEDLRNPKDFTVIDNGDGTATILFDGDYKDNDPITIYYELIDPVTDPISDDQPYTGEPIEPEVHVTFNGEDLEEGIDYVIRYEENEGTGEGKVIVEFIGDYEGCEDQEITFTIVKTVIDPSNLVIGEVEDQNYTGSQIKPEPTVTYNGVVLTANKDFTYNYGENVHAGEDEGIITIKFIGGFDGSEDVETTFNILPKTANPENMNITPSGDDDNPIQFPENGDDPFEPDIKIIDEETGEELVEGEDYILTVNEEEGTITIEFINDYEGTPSQTENFEKVPGDISENLTYDPIDDQEYDPEGNEPKPNIYLNGEPLEEGVDYILEYGEDEDGNPELVVKFQELYSETPDLHIPFDVVPKNMENPDIELDSESYPFSGNPIEPGVSIKDGDYELQEGVDYIVYYVNNAQPGTGEAIIEFIGNYSSTPTQKVEFGIKSTRLDNSSTNADGRSTVIVSFEDGFEPDITLYAILQETVPDEIKEQASKGGRFFGTYGDYEIKLFDKDGNEIQPSDIAEGTVLTLMIQLPSELEGRDVKIVHYHSADDISIIVRGEEAGIGTYIITEEGYLVTQIDKFSNFSLIYEETCIAHWILITAAILNILLIAAVIVMGKKQSKTLGISAIVAMAVITGVSAIFAHCTICYVMLGINGLLILFDILFFAFWKGKEEPAQVTQQPQVVYVQAPAQAAPVAPAPVVAEPAPTPEIKEELTLKESMAAAEAVVSELVVNKEVVASYLESNYKDSTIVNRKENYTKTGLPLADTHYVKLGNDKKCFIYVYELKDGKCFFIVKTSDDVYKQIKDKHSLTSISLFPQTRDGGKWYTVMIDESYKTLEDVYEVIDMVLEGFKAEPAKEVVKEPAPVVEEAPVEPLKLSKEIVANYLLSAHGNRVTVNRKQNYTKTGLPLADTHYVKLNAKKSMCFLYVYEIDSGEVFFIFKTSDEIYKAIKAEHNLIGPSDFPHTRDGAQWYNLMFDESFKTNKDVWDVLDRVINGFSFDGTAIKEPEPVKEPEPAPVVEESEEEGGIDYKYKFSFSARLIRAGMDRQDFYNEIKNEFFAYKNVNSKISWEHELFKLGRTKCGVMKVKGKTLCVYLPLDPSKYDQERFWFQDLREKGKEVEFPMMMKVKSDRAVKYVKELIADVMANNEIVRLDEPTIENYRLPEMTIEEMLTSDPVLAKLTDGSVPTPKKEVKPAPVKKQPEPVKEVKPEPAPVVVEEDEGGIDYKYKFSFSARLIRAGMDRQDFYNEIKNDILSYKKVDSKISWGHEFFKLGRTKIAQVKVKGKTLCVYLPLDPSKYDQERFWFQDLRVEGKEVEFPMMMKVKSDRAVKYVKELIADVMANNEIVRNDNYVANDFKLPEMTIEEMLSSNPPLAKLSDDEAVVYKK